MANWYLEGRGQRLTFEEWGLSEPVIRYASQDADVATFTYRGRWERQDDLFQYSDFVAIYKDGVKWFEGAVVMTPLIADAKGESIQYEVKGPWLYLEEHLFAVPWTSWQAADPTQIFCTHVLMNAGPGGTLVSTRVQTLAVLNFLLGLYAEGEKPFQLGNILPDGPLGDLYIPISEDRDRTCAQAVQHQLSWHRDAVTWFDYETTPPTLHMQAAGALESFTVGLGDGKFPIVSEHRIAARPDLQRPSVVIRYEKTNTINGSSKPSLSVDAWPANATGREFGAWDASVDLRGFDKTTVHGTLECETIDINSLAWWQKRVPELRNPRLRNVEVYGAERDGTKNYPRMLVEGLIAPWMELNDGTPVEFERETITVKAKFRHMLADPVIDPVTGLPMSVLEAAEMEDVLLSVQVTATNAPTGESSYEAVETFESGDPQPVGLARYLYETVAPLYHSGSLILTEPEVGGQARIGKRLYITGGKAEWATMNAIIQSVVEDVANGVTRVTFGAPDHLGLQDLVELLKVGRRRQRWTNPKTLEGEDLGELELGNGPPNTDSRIGPGRTESLRITPSTVPTDMGGNPKIFKMRQIYMETGIPGLSGTPQIRMETADDLQSGFLVQLAAGQGGPTAPGNYSQLVLGDPHGSFVMNLASTGEAPLPAGARLIMLRPMTVCVDGVQKRCFVFCGEPHDMPPS